MAGRGVRSRREPGTRQRQFCADLRHWRTLRQVSQQDLAAGVLHSRERVTKVEHAERWPAEDLARRGCRAGHRRRADVAVAARAGGIGGSHTVRGPRQLALVLPLWQPRPGLLRAGRSGLR